MVILRQRRKELRELLFMFFFQETKERERERTQKRARSVHTLEGKRSFLKKHFENFSPKHILKKKGNKVLTPTVAGSKHIASDSSNIAWSSLAREKKGFSVSSLFCSPLSFVVGSSSSFMIFLFFCSVGGAARKFFRSKLFVV